MDRRQFLKASSMVMGYSLLDNLRASVTQSVTSQRRPNILMITAHDLGQHLGCYGIKEVQSPNIDRLATKGVRFANMFSTSGVCSPARGSLHTGRYPQSNGLMGLTHAPWWWRLNPGEKHVAAILNQAGYETYLCGLQHVFNEGQAGEYGYQYILTSQTDAENTVKLAAQFLKQRKAKDDPFLLKVGFFEVHRKGGSFKHRPYDPSKPVFVPKYLADTPVMREDLGRYQEDIRYFDTCVGRILDALQAGACSSSTLVVFTADHGIPYPGAKWSVRDAGIEVPLLMYLPGSRLAGGRVYRELISNVDMLPTLLDLLGVPKPLNLQGVSFAAFLKGETKEKPRREIYAQFTPAMFRDNESRCIRTERYKLIRYFEAGRCMVFPIDVDPVRFSQHTERAANTGKDRPFAQLFDIVKDPDELEDIGGRQENAGIVKGLSRKLYNWMKAVDDPLLKGALQSPYYRQSMDDFENAAL
ncbi:MAG: sulfatase [Phycisphaerales bacterium]|nr:MAG: sulfatase [Phycisphaerales bacterium]